MGKRIGEKKIRELVDRWEMRLQRHIEKSGNDYYSDRTRISEADKAFVYSLVICDVKDLLLSEND